MTAALEAAAQAMRDAMRDAIRRHALWYLVEGGLLVIGGILALAYPILSSAGLVQLLGWILILCGLCQAISLIGARHVPHFSIQLITVVLSVLIGWLFLLQPRDGLGTLTLLLVVFFVVGGIAKVVFALTIRPLVHWYWLLGSGVVGLALAALLLAILPVSAPWVLGVLLGVQLVSEGSALGVLAWRAWGSRPQPAE